MALLAALGLLWVSLTADLTAPAIAAGAAILKVTVDFAGSRRRARSGDGGDPR